MRAFRIIPVLAVFILLGTSCQSGTTTPPLSSATPISPMRTPLPTEERASPEEFVERGFGFCLLAGDQIVSAATTFVVCRRRIEIQISTREKHQHKGLATSVAAHLLLRSLGLGLDPNRDAANQASVCLTQKLGYAPQGTYPPVLFAGSRLMVVVTCVGLKIKERVGK